jgi:hypothetical protein
MNLDHQDDIVAVERTTLFPSHLRMKTTSQPHAVYSACEQEKKGREEFFPPRVVEQSRWVRFYFPVPLSATVCGLLRALSVRFSLEFCAPVAFGVKVTLMTQLAPGFRVAGGVPQVVLDTVNSFAFGPLMFQEKLVSAAVPVLVTVSACV